MTLAQIGGLVGDPGSVPNLPAPPPLAHYLLESPWPVISGLAAAGVIALIVMQRRDRLGDGLRVLAVSLVLAIGVFVLAASVTTEREVLAARTQEAAIAAAGARMTDLRDLLTERALVRAFAGISEPHGKEELLKTVQSTLGGTIVIKDLKIGPVRAIVDGPNVARTQVRVWATPGGEQAMYNAPTGAWFRLGWTRDGEGPWRITTINVMQIDGLGVSPNPND